MKILLFPRDLVETHITEVPSYDGVTLLANFGGMLGLMTGMSALSLFEIVIWIGLLLAGWLNRFGCTFDGKQLGSN